MNNIDPDVKNITNTPRWIASKILTRIDRQDSYLDKLLENEYRTGTLDDKDKRLLNEITNGVLRNRNKIDWIIKQFYNGDFVKINPKTKNTLRVALYQILFLDKIPNYAIVNDAVEGIKTSLGEKQSRLVNAVLRNIIRQNDKFEFPSPSIDQIMFLSVVYSHPEWMVSRWFNRFGFDDTEKLLKANNTAKDLTLRINSLKTGREKVEIELLSKKIRFERSKYLDNFLHVKQVGNLSSFALLQNGDIYIQDVSAGLSVKLLDPKRNERIIDLCAAPGGKLTYIAELMGGTGELIAVDIFEMRLRVLQENCIRMGINNVKTILHDARNISLEPADRVLIDAPCSGLGTLSKKPDIKWKQGLDHIHRLGQVQIEILQNAANLVLPNGVLVYSTCTIEPDENSSVVQQFLSKNTNFILENASEFVPSELVSDEGFIETFPHKHQIDGSFAARLRRVS